MKSTLNNKSLHLIICFGLGYIVGCWSSVILALLFLCAFLFYRGDVVTLSKYKAKALPIINEIKKWNITHLLSNEQNIKKLEISIQKGILQDAEEYCIWAKIENIETFIECSIQQTLTKDRKWNNFLKRKRNLVP